MIARSGVLRVVCFGGTFSIECPKKYPAGNIMTIEETSPSVYTSVEKR